MIFRVLCLAFILSIATGAEAQVRGNEISVIVSPDHNDWTYDLNHTCTFTIQVMKAQNLLPEVVIDYEIGPEWYPTEKKTGIKLKDGKMTVEGKLPAPGFLRCKVTAYSGDKTYEGTATAAYAPKHISPFALDPDDFDEFWNNNIEEARKTPLNPVFELLPERCTEDVNVWHVSFQNVKEDSRTFGILCKPKKEGKYPALLRVPGAGVRPYHGDIETASKGAITLEIGVHGIPVIMEQPFYDSLAKGELDGYPYRDYDNKDETYYKKVFLGALRAVDFICSQPEFDGKTLGVTGSSQGGALSMVTAALDKRITFYAAIHPAMCDHRAHLHERAGGWPHYFFYGEKDHMKSYASDYYDMVNFAKRISVPGWYSWGYNDDVCPPTSIFAAYNSVKGKKEFHPYLETAHFWYQEQYDEWNRWIWKKMNLK